MTMTNAVRVLLPIVMICILEIYRGHTEHTLWIRVNHLVQPHRHFTYTLLHSHHLPYTPIHLTFLFPLHTHYAMKRMFSKKGLVESSKEDTTQDIDSDADLQE